MEVIFAVNMLLLLAAGFVQSICVIRLVMHMFEAGDTALGTVGVAALGTGPIAVFMLEGSAWQPSVLSLQLFTTFGLLGIYLTGWIKRSKYQCQPLMRIWTAAIVLMTSLFGLNYAASFSLDQFRG